MNIFKSSICAVALATSALTAPSALAQVAEESLHAGALEVPVNKSRVVSADRAIGRALIGLDFPSPFERDALLMTIPSHGEGYRLCEPVDEATRQRLMGR